MESFLRYYSYYRFFREFKETLDFMKPILYRMIKAFERKVLGVPVLSFYVNEEVLQTDGWGE